MTKYSKKPKVGSIRPTSADSEDESTLVYSDNESSSIMSSPLKSNHNTSISPSKRKLEFKSEYGSPEQDNIAGPSKMSRKDKYKLKRLQKREKKPNYNAPGSPSKKTLELKTDGSPEQYNIEPPNMSKKDKYKLKRLQKREKKKFY